MGEVNPRTFCEATDWAVVQTNVSTTTVQVALPDSQRLSIRFEGVNQLSALNGPLLIGPTPLVNTQRAFEIQERVQYKELFTKDYGRLVCGPWWCRAQQGTATISVITASLTRGSMLTWGQQSNLQDQLSTLRQCVSDLSNYYAAAASKLRELLLEIQSRNSYPIQTRVSHFSLDSQAPEPYEFR